MATYIDVSALVGIKIHSSGTLTTSETVSVPANCYAKFDIIQGGVSMKTDNMASGGVTFGFLGTKEFTLSGVVTGYTTSGGSTPYCFYTIFSNNQ